MPQRASDHNVPINASMNNAIGATQTGRLSEAMNVPASIAGSITSTSTTPKIPTSEVDQGSDKARSTATISAAVIQAAGSLNRFNSSAPIGRLAAITPCLLVPGRPAG